MTLDEVGDWLGFFVAGVFAVSVFTGMLMLLYAFWFWAVPEFLGY